MKELRTEIHIQASRKRVWQVLIDTGRYPEWNPFITRVQGSFVEGKNLYIDLHPADKKPMTIRPRVLSVRKDEELRWRGHLLMPGIFDGEHIFQLEELADNTTRFIHREEFGGVLVPLFTKLLDDNTRRGFDLMNQALKVRCEDADA